MLSYFPFISAFPISKKPRTHPIMPDRGNGEIVQARDDDISNVEVSGGGSPRQVREEMRGGNSRRHSNSRISSTMSPITARDGAIGPESVKRTRNGNKKGTVTRKPTTSNGGRRFRLTALFPFVLSTIAFILTLLIVLSGTKPGYLEDVHLLDVSSWSSLISGALISFRCIRNGIETVPSLTSYS